MVHMWREWVQWCTCGGLGSGFSGAHVERVGSVVHRWRPREWVQWCTCGGLGSGFSGAHVEA